jgi:ubiquitin carboxyl-terminal hydrolase 5/13
MASCTHVDNNNTRSPKSTDRVHKEECTLCYKTWEDDEGIFVCLSCFNGGCKKHAELHYKKRKHPLVLNIKRVLKPQLSVFYFSLFSLFLLFSFILVYSKI